MKTFNDLEFKAHPYQGHFDQQAVLNFPNGYGVSVVNGRGAYCGPGTYEVAILKDGNIDYSTEITDDVLSYQTPDEITEVMAKLQNMPA